MAIEQAPGAVGWFRALVIDAEDPDALADFWSRLLGVEVSRREEGWLQLDPGKAGVYLAFQPATGDRPTGLRVRPDIEVVDVDAAREACLAIGATHVRRLPEPMGGYHEMMADPEGNEFCLVQPLPDDWARHWPGIDD